MLKQIKHIHSAPAPHWVGDGFPVRSLFSYHQHAQELSPFLLLDYAGPYTFSPTTHSRGVGSHPHRGFETVTIVYEGEVAHQDSTGAGGTIGPGDVQWMTAAAGIVHEEFHSKTFARQGGELEMVQLWVNLPSEDKMSPPAYQTILNGQIPRVSLDKNAGQLRVIAGEFQGHQGPARTFTPINVWDVALNAEGTFTFEATPGYTLAIVVLQGTVLLNETAVLRQAQWAQFGTEGSTVQLEANNACKLLVLSGEPINEAIVGHGPFVMNSHDEIVQAFDDFNQGNFGKIVR